MTLVESYSLLFADMLLGYTIIPIHYAYVYTAMNIFDGYNEYVILTISIIAITCASIINYYCARLLLSVFSQEWIISINKRYSKARTLLFKYGSFLPLLAPVPLLGPLIIFGLGVIKLPLHRVILFSLLGSTVFFLI